MRRDTATDVLTADEQCWPYSVALRCFAVSETGLQLWSGPAGLTELWAVAVEQQPI